MNILFIQNNGINESFIISDIVGYLKSKAHGIALFIANEEKHLLKKIVDFNPELIVFPASLFDKEWYFNLARQVRPISHAPILFWGAAATFYPREMLAQKECDLICRGEGEYAIAELAESIQKGDLYHHIENIGYRLNGEIHLNPLRRLVEDLDSLPLPDRDIYYRYPVLANINMKRFITSRGCSQLCHQCWNNAVSNIYGNPQNFYRRKSPQRVIEEILIVKEKYPLTNIHFSDDLFVHPRYYDWLYSFLETYRQKIKIPFTCNVRPDYITDELISRFQAAGSRAVAMSVESGSSHIRNEILAKKIDDEHIFNAARILHKHDIKIMTFNIIATPQETLEDMYSTIELNQKIKAHYTRIGMAFPLCHSTLYAYAQEKGIINGDEFNSIPHNIDAAHRKPVIKVDKEKPYENLFLLFPLAIMLRIPRKIIQKLIRLPLGVLYKLIWMISIQVSEKDFFAVSIKSGIPYFLHTRGVSNRSVNLTSIF